MFDSRIRCDRCGLEMQPGLRFNTVRNSYALPGRTVKRPSLVCRECYHWHTGSYPESLVELNERRKREHLASGKRPL